MALSVWKLRDLPPRLGATVFRVDRLRPGVAAATLAGIVVACLWIGWRGGISFAAGRVPAGIAWWAAAGLGPFLLLGLNDLRKAWHADAWLAIAGLEGLYLACRSFRNAHHERGERSVVLVPYGDIVAARTHLRSTAMADDRGATTTRQSFVDLDLGETDTSALRDLLERERALPTSRGRWNHFPVTLEPGNCISIEWHARPGAAAFLETLRGRGVRIDGPRMTETDLTGGVGDADLERLARRGDGIALVQILRRRDGLDLSAARSRAAAMIDGARAQPRD